MYLQIENSKRDWKLMSQHPGLMQGKRGAILGVTIEDVGASALDLLSDMSRGVAGEVHHVESGDHVLGMKRPEAPDISLSKD